MLRIGTVLPSRPTGSLEKRVSTRIHDSLEQASDPRGRARRSAAAGACRVVAGSVVMAILDQLTLPRQEEETSDNAADIRHAGRARDVRNGDPRVSKLRPPR